MIEGITVSFLSASYIAGSCLPLFAPAGWREQELPVRLVMLEALVPQYLQ